MKLAAFSPWGLYNNGIKLHTTTKIKKIPDWVGPVLPDFEKLNLNIFNWGYLDIEFNIRGPIAINTGDKLSLSYKDTFSSSMIVKIETKAKKDETFTVNVRKVYVEFKENKETYTGVFLNDKFKKIKI